MSCCPSRANSRCIIMTPRGAVYFYSSTISLFYIFYPAEYSDICNNICINVDQDFLIHLVE